MDVLETGSVWILTQDFKIPFYTKEATSYRADEITWVSRTDSILILQIDAITMRVLHAGKIGILYTYWFETERYFRKVN